ncbi:MAG: mechanosensitive ion channel family protein [Elusimicrobia bacterium]|nr:mechanosensitive ion channel family protein [Elusimicrobiota bacterium]MBU2614313.1 mechanosensitive ion channel family protein [Elusimicrobiota bacterium]
MHKDLLVAFIVFGVVFGAGYALRQMLFKFLINWSLKTKTNIDAIVIASIKTPFLFWAALLGIAFATRATSLSPNITIFIDKVAIAIWVISLTLVVSKIMGETIKTYSDKFHTSALPVTTLTTNVANIIIFIVGSLIILNLLGISIAPILTTLGIGGLAVALALQETLSNLFAGIYTILTKQINVGDYILLDSGQEGYVDDIGWRSSRIRTLPNNIIIIPNNKLSQAIVTNYFQPEKELAITLDFHVDYKSDLEKVEKVTIEVAKDVMKSIQGGIADFEPFVRFNSLNDLGIKLTVILRVREFADKYVIVHEFIKRLKNRYDKENIIVPIPSRNVNINK